MACGHMCDEGMLFGLCYWNYTHLVPKDEQDRYERGALFISDVFLELQIDPFLFCSLSMLTLPLYFWVLDFLMLLHYI